MSNENNFSLVLLSLVAIVALVGLVLMGSNFFNSNNEITGEAGWSRAPPKNAGLVHFVF